jgi:hypothetical protein
MERVTWCVGRMGEFWLSLETEMGISEDFGCLRIILDGNGGK